MKYVAYYRVSTKRQGESGLGLEAQKSSVEKFTSTGELLTSFTDVESGKNNNRPALAKAIEFAKNNEARLIIAKLDRLSRNAAFIFTLRDSHVDFVCADMPDANRVTIGIMAVLAQDEQERISQRTKAALSALKERGVKLGTPTNLTGEARSAGTLARIKNSIDNSANRQAGAIVVSMRKENKSFNCITAAINDLGFKSRRGGIFHQTQVKRLYERYA